MRMTAILAVIISILGLGACSGGGGGGSSPANAGTERSLSRTDGAVTVLPGTSGDFTATQVITINNDDAGKTLGVVQFENANGSISSSSGGSGYQVQVTLTATAQSDAQARAALASMSVSHRDALDANTLYLQNSVNYANFTSNHVSRSATVAATLPVALDYRLFHYSTNGTANSTGLTGSEAKVQSENGAAGLSGTWDSAEVDSANGTVTVSGDIPSLSASTSNGAVQATIASIRPTVATLDSVNGSVDVTVTQGAGSVFDLDASSNVGMATIAVAGTVPQGTQSTNHAHYQSTNYASGNPKVSVTGRTSTGSVTIHD